MLILHSPDQMPHPLRYFSDSAIQILFMMFDEMQADKQAEKDTKV